MTDPTPHTIEEIQRSLAREIQALGITARKMLVRSMMPTIDIAQRKGVGYEALAKTLEAAGLVLKPDALRKALFRWRQQHPALTAETTPPLSPSSSTSSPEPVPTLSVGSAPRAVTNKADLVRLRMSKEPIDLNALAELGRQK